MPDGSLPDMLVTRQDALHVRDVRESSREADFVASTAAIDRHHEVVDQDSWRLDAFKKNPVILYGHQSYELPIGQATRVELVDGQLECTVRFATEDANPKAEQVWQLVKQKVLRAVSVGFRPNDGRYELRGGEEVFVYRDCELREISVVAIPANPEALAKMKTAARERDKANEPAAPAATTPSKSGGTETTMNEKELQAQIEKMNLQVAEAKLAEKTATEKATALDAKVKALETSNATLTTEKAALTEELAKTATARDAATKRADEAESKLVDHEVDALVGVKITKAERDDFVSIRKSSPDVFKSMIEKRPDMKLTERVTTDGETKSDKPLNEQVKDDDGKKPADVWNKL